MFVHHAGSDTRCIGDYEHPYTTDGWARLRLKPIRVLHIHAEPELKMLLSFSDFSRTMYRNPPEFGANSNGFPLYQSIASGSFLLREARPSSADLNPSSDKHLGKKKANRKVLESICPFCSVTCRMCIISTWTLFAKAVDGTLPCINRLHVEDWD